MYIYMQLIIDLLILHRGSQCFTIVFDVDAQATLDLRSSVSVGAAPPILAQCSGTASCSRLILYFPCPSLGEPTISPRSPSSF